MTHQIEIDSAVWRAGDHVAQYSNRILRPVEAVLLARYREALSGRVLEIGCGAGRLTGYLVALGGEVHGIDLAPAMVERCRRAYPRATVNQGDLRDLEGSVNGRFDAIFASYNVLDVLDDRERRRVLSEIRALLAPSGLLLFSSHNLAHVDRRGEEGLGGGGARRLAGKLDRSPSSLVGMAVRLPVRVRNRRRLSSLQLRAVDHAILNDEAHDYCFLHYYIRRDDQRRQLSELGYELIECLDLEGRRVEPGHEGQGPELHYIATPG